MALLTYWVGMGVVNGNESREVSRGKFVYDLLDYCENIGCSECEEMPLESLIMKNEMTRYILKISL